MKKRKLLTWKDSRKVLKVSGMDQVKELQEDRSLLARLMVVFKSRPDHARSQGSDWAVRVFCGSEVFVCVRWHDASLFRKEHFEDHHNKAWWWIAEENDHKLGVFISAASCCCWRYGRTSIPGLQTISKTVYSWLSALPVESSISINPVTRVKRRIGQNEKTPVSYQDLERANKLSGRKKLKICVLESI